MTDRTNTSLDLVFKEFEDSPTQKNYENVITKIFLMAKDKETAITSSEISSQGNLTYELVGTTDGYYYTLYTSSERTVSIPAECILIVYLDKFIAKAANDTEVNGICVNPNSVHPVFLPRSYIKKILSL